MNVFPSAIQEGIAGADDISSGHFRITLEGPGPYDRVKVRAEAADTLAQESWEGAARELEKRMRDTVGASAEIEIVAFETFPRTDGKTSFIERI